jgi:hypothetical protein
MAGVMGLGQVGPDGQLGGRLERELEVFENVVRGKRKGYREKVKARESGGSTLNGKEDMNGEEGGEREAKRARFEGLQEEQPEEHNSQLDEEVNANGSGAISPSEHSRHPQRHHSISKATQAGMSNGSPHSRANDETLPDYDHEEDHEDNAAEDDERDETQPEDDDDENQDEEDEEDEEDEDQKQSDEDELGGYGPDDQLRIDMNGGGDDADGSGGESD